MKKILITGNSGYIGSHLTKILKGEYQVYGLDKVEPQEAPDTFYHCDINRPFSLEDEFDAVIHLAALVNVGESEIKPIQYYITNLNGTMNVLNKIKTKNFIFASTGAADGCASAYGISKRAAEDVVREYCTTHRPTPYTIFRFYNVIGSDGIPPTNVDGLFYNLMKAQETGEFNLYGDDYGTRDGSPVRDYVHVNEICHAIWQAIETPAMRLENLGHGIGMTVKQMVDIYKKVNNCEFKVNVLPRRPGDLQSSVLDNPSKYMVHLYTNEELLRAS